MMDFLCIIKDYGAVFGGVISGIASGIIAYVAWKARSEWRRQKRITLAEKYHDALWETKDNIRDGLKITTLLDIANEHYNKNIVEYESLENPNRLMNVKQNVLKLQRIEAIFLEIKQDIQKFKYSISLIYGKVIEVLASLDSITDTSIKEDAMNKIIKLFDNDSDEIKQLEEAYEKIDNYFTEFIATELNK